MCDIGKVQEVHINVPKPIPITIMPVSVPVEPVKIPVPLVVRR